MLPDFVSVKSHVQKRVVTLIRAFVARDAFLSQFKSEVHFEGDGTAHGGDDGFRTGYEQFSVPIEVPQEEVLELGPDAFVARIPELARMMIQQQTGLALGRIEESAARGGNTVDGKGQPFTIELFMESLERMDLEFDADGKVKHLVFVGPESLRKNLFAELTPEQQARLDALLERKRREYHDRESNRKLAD